MPEGHPPSLSASGFRAGIPHITESAIPEKEREACIERHIEKHMSRRIPF